MRGVSALAFSPSSHLHIAYERWGSSSDPSFSGHLHYSNDVDRSLNETAVDKIRKYHSDYNNNPPNGISFMTGIPSTSERLHSEFVILLFLQALRETDGFFCILRSSACTTSPWTVPLPPRGVLLTTPHIIILNIDVAPVSSRSHTHPSQSQTSRLLTSSLSLGVPVSHVTQCM